MNITTNREMAAYNKIDKMIENENYDKNWFLTMKDLNERIKPDIDKYYEFCLFILETCVPVTIDEKAVYKELEQFIKAIPIKE